MPGVRVEVRCRFVERWARGYEVADVLDDGTGLRYLLRRISDQQLLPEHFGAEELRPAPARLPDRWARPERTPIAS